MGFSMGILLWEMLATSLHPNANPRKIPHGDLGFGQVLAAVGWGGLTPDLNELSSLPENGATGDLRSIVTDCLNFLPEERPSSRKVKRRLQRLPRTAQKEALTRLAAFFCSLIRYNKFSYEVPCLGLIWSSNRVIQYQL